ncbi:FkbM family methyltransferase [Mycobacterium lepromatosis]|uniref:Methyltransferase FkbM domain-containing protein n=1 Tax=Mycobacterium lepromatosis TaxID=480418 RepID=A0A0F4EST2_9MYCO|nr:FkbM family methyltransferase [Mycobacterium lepromatosis]KJX74680.1 hypothetical protein MLPM_2346 [Mycobacterium lepromatosis]UKN42842.1 hypothetical protein MLPF_2688 [Mycobacterium lepromatosis]
MKRPNLIIDVGMHNGQDTAFYLAKGFDVVALEANPVLVDAARIRFASEIESGQLQILPEAIAATEGTLPLAICDEESLWTSMSPAIIERNKSMAGVTYHYIDVPARTFVSVLEEVGVPHYLKVDIEGLDMLCVHALKQADNLPDFISIESSVSSPAGAFDAAFEELAVLWELGYRRFAYVDQRKHSRYKPPNPAREGCFASVDFTEHCSGLFGEELPVRWEMIDKAVRRAQVLQRRYNVRGFGGKGMRSLQRFLPMPSHRTVSNFTKRPFGRRLVTWTMEVVLSGWYDLHARLD